MLSIFHGLPCLWLALLLLLDLRVCPSPCSMSRRWIAFEYISRHHQMLLIEYAADIDNTFHLAVWSSAWYSSRFFYAAIAFGILPQIRVSFSTLLVTGKCQLEWRIWNSSCVAFCIIHSFSTSVKCCNYVNSYCPSETIVWSIHEYFHIVYVIDIYYAIEFEK